MEQNKVETVTKLFERHDNRVLFDEINTTIKNNLYLYFIKLHQ